MTPGLDVLLEGEWRPGGIDAPLDPHWRSQTSPELEEHVARVWADSVAEAAAHQRLLFPGPLCRVLGYTTFPGGLRLSLGQSDFRWFLGTRSLDNPAMRADPLTVCAALVTADSKIMVGGRSQRNFEGRGVWHLIAGYVDPTIDGAAGRVDVFHSIAREIEEETACAGKDLSLVCLGMAHWPALHKFELLFSATTPRTSSELRCPAGDEHDELRAIDHDPDAIREFLAETSGALVLAGRACLVRYAAWRFGVAL